MAVTPGRFEVEDGEIIDTKARQIISLDQLATVATPDEQASIQQQLNQTEWAGSDQSLEADNPVTARGSISRPNAAEAPSSQESLPSRPSLQQFMDVAREDNPGVSDRDLRRHWAQHYSDINPKTLPSLETFMKASKEDNPGVPEQALKAYWEEHYGDFGAAEKESGDFGRGFSTAFKQIPQLGYGVASGVGAAGESMLGEGGISTKLKEWGVAGYLEKSKQIYDQSKPSDDFTYSWDQAKQGNFGALVDWMQYGLGYMGAQGAQMLATAGAGSLAGRLAQGPISTMAAGLVAKEAARIKATQLGSALAAEELGKLATANVASRIGQTTALAAAAIGMEGGEIFGDLSAESVKSGQSLSGEQLAKAFGSTLAAGGLEFVGDKLGLDLILGKTLAGKVGGRAARMGAGAAAGAAVEGGTEVGQTLIEEYGKGHDPFSPESMREAVNAGALGALGGTVLGGAGGIVKRAEEPPAVVPIESIPDQIGVGNPTVSIDQAIKNATDILSAPVSATRPQEDALSSRLAQLSASTAAQREADSLESERQLQSGERLPSAQEAAMQADGIPRTGQDIPLLEGQQSSPSTLPIADPSRLWMDEAVVPGIEPGQAFTPRASSEPDAKARLQAERERLLSMRKMPSAPSDMAQPVMSETPSQSDMPIQSAADLAYPSSERGRMPTQEELALRDRGPEKRAAQQVPLIEGGEGDATSTIIPGATFSPRQEPVLTPKERLAAEREKLVRMKATRPAPMPSEPTVPPSSTTSDAPLRSAVDRAYPSVSELHDLARDKGFDVESPVFKTLTKMSTGKTHLDELSPSARDRFAETLKKLTPRETPTIVESPTKKALAPVQPGSPSSDAVTAPRSALPPEQNAEMLLRAEKANADLESSSEMQDTSLIDFLKSKGGLQDQGGELSTMEVDAQRKAFSKKLIQEKGLTLDQAAELAHEAGYIQDRDIALLLDGIDKEVRGKGQHANWYRELTTGPKPMTREAIDSAVAKIIEDHGVDTGAAVERVKAALLNDGEFDGTQWGEDAASIARGDWPAWIPKPDALPQQGATPQQEPVSASPSRKGTTTTPPQSEAATVPAEEPFSLTQQTARADKPKPKATQLSIDVPPPTVGERPIIGREVTPEEAPLFSESAKQPDAEQTDLTDGLSAFDNQSPYEQRSNEPAARNRALAREALAAIDGAASVHDQRGDIPRSGIPRPARPEEERLAGLERAGIRTPAVAISKDLATKGRVDLRGYTVTSMSDLATISQVLRNPRVETLRFFYVKNRKIVGHEGITSRMPGAAVAFPISRNDLEGMTVNERVDKQEGLAKDMIDRMERLGADGYYMLHNHPSGVSRPSRADIQLTRLFDQVLPGLLGHVVIDSNEYSTIDASGNVATHQLPAQKDAILEPYRPHRLLAPIIKDPESLATVGKAMQTTDGYITIVYVSGGDGKTRAIQEIPKKLFLNVREATNFLRGQSRAFGAMDALAYADTNDTEVWRAARELQKTGSLLDFAGMLNGKPESLSRHDQYKDYDHSFGVPHRLIGGMRVSDNASAPPSSQRSTISIDGIERPTMNSNGAPIAKTEESIRNFWKWFGNSQAVDAQGRPVVVYHGTGKKFTTFSKKRSTQGILWFTSNRDAVESGDVGAQGRGHIMELYAKVDRPAGWREYDRLLLAQFKGERLDGAILKEKNGQFDGFVFEPSQLKSAIGNSGAFDPNDSSIVKDEGIPYGTGTDYVRNSPDAKPSGRKLGGLLNNAQRTATDDIALTYDDLNSPNFPGIPAQKQQAALTYHLPAMSRMDNVIRSIQDKNIDLVRLVDSIKQAGAPIPDELNPVLREELYMGRVTASTQGFLNEELRPLVDAMRLNKVTLAQLDQYLHARHAKEANAHLKEINPDREDNDALSGMTDAEAERILAAADKPKMDRLAAKVDAILGKTRQMLVEYGLESQSTVDGWAQDYQFYVPLHREGYEDGTPGTGQGRSVRGSHSKSRTGSTLSVTNIMANIAMDRERAIVRGEKMRPVIALAGLLQQYPNKDIATLAKPSSITYTNPETGLQETAAGDIGEYRVPRIKGINKKTGMVEWRPDPLYKGRDNVINFRINGEDHAIIFNEENDRAVEMAKSLKDLDVGRLNGVLAAIAPATRYLSSISTQYNPVFGVVNFVRDIQFAMLSLSSTPLSDKRAEVFMGTFRALRGIYADARAERKGERVNSEMSKLWERFQKVGGPTGYREMFRGSNDRAKAIEHMLDPDWWQKTLGGKILTANGHLSGMQSLILNKAAKPLFEWLSDYNQTMENAVRLSTFKAGIDSGMTDEQAASTAKNLTVNFNKKGAVTTQVGAMYAFFNASVQGTARIADTLFEKGRFGYLSATGKKIVAGGIALGSLQALGLMLAGFGEDEPPEFVRARSLILPMPGTDKGYLAIPMPLGFNILPNFGRLVTESLIHGKPMDRAYTFMANLVDTFSPVGGAGSVSQFLAPSVADPLVALSENKDWAGRKISKEDFNAMKPTPGHTRAKDSSTPWARGLSEMINYATGGTNYVPGKFSPTPDAIDYLIGSLTGGVGRELAHTAQSVTGLTTGEDVPLHKVPLVGRFVGDAAGPSAVRNDFYENLSDVHQAYEEVHGRLLHREDATDFLADHPEARLEKMATHLQREISQMTKRKREMVAKGESRERVRLLEMQISSKMQRFNDRVKELQESR